MIIIKYLNFINESAEESKIGIKSLVQRIQEMNKKNKEANSGTTTTTTTDELLTGVTYLYTPEDTKITPYNVTITSVTDKDYICKKEDGNPINIDKTHKKQFTKVDKPTEPTKIKIIIGYVYECADKNNYLITSESADNVGKEYNGVNINKINNLAASKILIENIKIDKKSFTDFVGNTISSADINTLKYYVKLITTYRSNAGKNWSSPDELISEINKQIKKLSEETPPKPETKSVQGAQTPVQGESQKSVQGEAQKSVQGAQTPQPTVEVKNADKRKASELTPGKKG